MLVCRACLAQGTYTVTYSSTPNPITVVGPNGQTSYDQYSGTGPYGGGDDSHNPGGGSGGGGAPGGACGSTCSASWNGVSSAYDAVLGECLGQAVNPTGISGTGSVNCNGTITATLTWTGPGDPPTSILVEEDSDTDWDGSSGSTTDGFPSSYSVSAQSGPVAPDYELDTSPTGEVVGASEDVIVYTLVTNPGNSFTITIQPTATASLPAVIPGLLAANASVSYNVNVIIPTISYRGTTLDSSMHDNILSGQVVYATLNVPGCTIDPDSYTWSTKATTAFYNY